MIDTIRKEELAEDLDMSYLDDCNIHVYDEDLVAEVRLMANQSGVVVLDQLVPFVTTHVICHKETLELRQELNQMDTRIREGAVNQKDALMINKLHVVTIDWLKTCLCRQ